jgi:hypothetical protein
MALVKEEGYVFVDIRYAAWRPIGLRWQGLSKG